MSPTPAQRTPRTSHDNMVAVVAAREPRRPRCAAREDLVEEDEFDKEHGKEPKDEGRDVHERRDARRDERRDARRVERQEERRDQRRRGRVDVRLSTHRIERERVCGSNGNKLSGTQRRQRRQRLLGGLYRHL